MFIAVIDRFHLIVFTDAPNLEIVVLFFIFPVLLFHDCARSNTSRNVFRFWRNNHSISPEISLNLRLEMANVCKCTQKEFTNVVHGYSNFPGE